MSNDTDTDLDELVEMDCAGCGTKFGITHRFMKRRIDDGHTFYCPAGHSNRYENSAEDRAARANAEAQAWEKEAQRLLAERDMLKERLARRERGTSRPPWRWWGERR